MKRRIEITLATGPDYPDATVAATLPSDGSVLAVHHVLNLDRPGRHNGWAVTHTPTGRNVGVTFSTRAEAMKLARAFGERPEWDDVTPAGGIENVGREFAVQLMDAARAIGGATRGPLSGPPAAPAREEPKRLTSLLPLDPGRVLALAEESMFGMGSTGICKACGEDQEGCEPDARGYECDSCGERQVYGAEELVIELC